MTCVGYFLLPAGLSSICRREMSGWPTINSQHILISTKRLALSNDQVTATKTINGVSDNRRFEKKHEVYGVDTTTLPAGNESGPYAKIEELEEEERPSLKDYFEQAKEFIRPDGGPPRWFSPLECGSRLTNSPLLLFLPGIDGTGLGLIMHHQSLGKIFDIWCLHIPVNDRTPFKELVKMVARTIRQEYHHSPNRPIYLVGETLGACLALSVAALNPDIDLILILANPATSFNRSQLQPLVPFLELLPDLPQLSLPYMLSLMTGNSLKMVTSRINKGFSAQQMVGQLSRDVLAAASYLSVLANILPRETLFWKVRMLSSASAFTNSRIHAVKAETLILSSGKDQLLPSWGETERLTKILLKSETRTFEESGHFLFLESDVDMATVIKGAAFYRRSQYFDSVFDYIPPTPYEFKKLYDSSRWLYISVNPVALSTLECGKIVRGLAGIPSEGPVLLIGYHMLMGFELAPLVSDILMQKNILVRGMAHPMMFKKFSEGGLPHLPHFDTMSLMGAVPVSASNFYKLFSSQSHVLLYPGGVREALHRKGEEYKLFWPEQSEFVRMAARFGAKIVPFGVVGEDDIGELFFDYNDQMKIPYFRNQIEQLTRDTIKLRTDANGEVTNQDLHLPGILPKLPGRFYYYFGKPIETEGRKHELRDKEKAHELYEQVKTEVESCIAYLKEKRESDPYRNLLPRLIYQATNGFSSQVPTFEL